MKRFGVLKTFFSALSPSTDYLDCGISLYEAGGEVKNMLKNRNQFGTRDLSGFHRCRVRLSSCCDRVPGIERLVWV